MKASRKQESDLNRSEQVRERRSQRAQDRAAKAANQVRYSTDAPTVFVRGGLKSANPRDTRRNGYTGGFGTPVVDRTQSRVRRKMTIPVNSAGVELVMPAMPIIHFGWRLLSFVLTAVFGFALYAALFTDQFTVGLPEVTGLERLSVDDIETIIGLEGTPIFLIDLNQVRSELSDAFPELTDLQVSVSMPSQVMIAAVERKPVMAWQYSDRTLWIDEEGAIFPARGEVAEQLLTVQADVIPPLLMDPAGLIELENQAKEAETGDKPERKEYEFNLYQRKIDPAVRDALVTLSQQMPAGAALAYNQIQGFGWHDERGWDVFMGMNLDNLSVKLTMYNQIIDQLSQQGVQPTMVSVAHIHAPFYRTEQ